MPMYEFRCPDCGARDEVFVRSVTATVTPPNCGNPKCATRGAMSRTVSKFARHFTEADKIANAEAKWGKEVDAVMGAEDKGMDRMARFYESRSKDLPPPDKVEEL
jgi:putative FmdB family regulatory protein